MLYEKLPHGFTAPYMCIYVCNCIPWDANKSLILHSNQHFLNSSLVPCVPIPFKDIGIPFRCLLTLSLTDQPSHIIIFSKHGGHAATLLVYFIFRGA